MAAMEDQAASGSLASRAAPRRHSLALHVLVSLRLPFLCRVFQLLSRRQPAKIH